MTNEDYERFYTAIMGDDAEPTLTDDIAEAFAYYAGYIGDEVPNEKYQTFLAMLMPLLAELRRLRT